MTVMIHLAPWSEGHSLSVQCYDFVFTQYSFCNSFRHCLITTTKSCKKKLHSIVIFLLPLLNFYLAFILPAACLQPVQGVSSSLISFGGQIQSIKSICDGKVYILKILTRALLGLKTTVLHQPYWRPRPKITNFLISIINKKKLKGPEGGVRKNG